MKRLTYILAMVLATGCGPRQNQKIAETAPATSAKQSDLDLFGVSGKELPIYYKELDGEWNDTCEVFHFWLVFDENDYLFDVPTDEQIEAWKKLCEERNPFKPGNKDGVPNGYLNMSQYVTVHDFIELWYRDDSYRSNLDLFLWRMRQYDWDQIYEPDSEYDRFHYLKNSFQGLCVYEPGIQYEYNLWAGLRADFQEIYAELMAREAIRHASPPVAKALAKEEQTYQNYHNEVIEAFKIIDGDKDGLSGSAWGMAISGISEDDAHMREISLDDYYFALTDSLDYEVRHRRSVIGSYEIKKQSNCPQEKVLKEYQRFMGSFEDDEYHYSIPERKKALFKEMDAWKKWMKSRDAVSSLLTGLCKEAYDNATNNVRRYKYIMLKNCYAGYGVTSNDVLELIIPYDASDEDLNGPNFNEKWNESY